MCSNVMKRDELSLLITTDHGARKVLNNKGALKARRKEKKTN